MATELRSKRQPAAEGREGCCGGFNEKELKKKVNFFPGKEPNEENKGGRAEGAGIHTSAANAGEDGGMCAACEEFLSFVHRRSLLMFRLSFRSK